MPSHRENRINITCGDHPQYFVVVSKKINIALQLHIPVILRYFYYFNPQVIVHDNLMVSLHFLLKKV